MAYWATQSLKVNRSRRGSNKGVVEVEFALLDGDEFPIFLHLVVRRDALSSNENCAESATHYNSALLRSDGHGKHLWAPSDDVTEGKHHSLVKGPRVDKTVDKEPRTFTKSDRDVISAASI